jgi:hypothetical protein
VHRDGGSQVLGLGVQCDADELRIHYGKAGDVLFAIDDLAELAAIEPYAAAVGTEVDIDVMARRLDKRGAVNRAVHLGSPSADLCSVEGLLRP